MVFPLFDEMGLQILEILVGVEYHSHDGKTFEAHITLARLSELFRKEGYKVRSESSIRHALLRLCRQGYLARNCDTHEYVLQEVRVHARLKVLRQHLDRMDDREFWKTFGVVTK
jgi:hypothetical protein